MLSEDEKNAIERLEELLNFWKKQNIKNSDCEIILNLITKLQKENEHWKNAFERELENNRKNTCELLKQDSILRKKDKQIDLMINFIYKTWCKYPGTMSHALRKNGFNDDECGTCENTDRNCVKCLKQYFKRLSKNK